VFVPLTFDTMLAAHMLDENRSKSLKVLSQVLLGVDAYNIGEDVRDAQNVPIKRLARYNAKDTDYTLRLRNLFAPQLVEDQRQARVFKRLTMPASNMLTKVERAGMQMDPARWEKRYREAQKARRTYDLAMRKAVPNIRRGEFNFNSPKQLAWWLFEVRGNSIIEETKNGAASTKESVLLRLAKKDKAAKALLGYRRWTKYLNTYLEPWGRLADDRHRLHPTYKLYGTVTHRLSCENPNLQQVPRNPFIRGVLGAAKGYVLLSADYSQIELRIAAMLANETRMLRAFKTGEDIHLGTAVDLTGKTPSLVTKEERKLAKAVNFGFLYSMGWEKFIEYARDNYDLVVTEGEAVRFRRKFFDTYPKLLPWHDRQRRLAERYGQVRSPLGRVRHLPTVRSADRQVRAEAERQAINSPVQSTASDLLLMSAVRLDSELPTREARIVGLVHDQLLFEVQEHRVHSIGDHVQGVMEDMSYVRKQLGVEITVPIVAELEIGTHWGDLEPVT
jgi:DNA polymerase I-like protein with 3'-5' exonuclease and polymerase domains